MTNGVYVSFPKGGTESSVVLEFNAFLKWIGSGTIHADSLVAARVYTDGKRRRAGDLVVFKRVVSGEIGTENLRVGERDGILATGEEAEVYYRCIEEERSEDDESQVLLRAASAGQVDGAALLRALPSVSAAEPSQLLRVSDQPDE